MWDDIERYEDEIYDIDRVVGSISYGGYGHDYLRSPVIDKMLRSSTTLNWNIDAKYEFPEGDILDIDYLMKVSELIDRPKLTLAEKQVYYGKLDERFFDLIEEDEDRIILTKKEQSYQDMAEDLLAPAVYVDKETQLWTICRSSMDKITTLLKEDEEKLDQALIQAIPYTLDKMKATELYKVAIERGYIKNTDKTSQLMQKLDMIGNYAYKIRGRYARRHVNYRVIRAIIKNMRTEIQVTPAAIREMDRDMNAVVRMIQYGIKWGVKAMLRRYGLPYYAMQVMEILYSRCLIPFKIIIRYGKPMLVTERYRKIMTIGYESDYQGILSDVWSEILSHIKSHQEGNLRLVSKAFNGYFFRKYLVKFKVKNNVIRKMCDHIEWGDCFFCYLKNKSEFVKKYHAEISLIMTYVPYVLIFEGELIVLVRIIKDMTYDEQYKLYLFLESYSDQYKVIFYSQICVYLYSEGYRQREIMIGKDRYYKDLISLFLLNVSRSQVIEYVESVKVYSDQYATDNVRFVDTEFFQYKMYDNYFQPMKRSMLGYRVDGYPIYNESNGKIYISL